MRILKKIINHIINFFGYEINKKNQNIINKFDDWTKFLIENSKPIIFDVGAGNGQSIKRYKKIFEFPEIHSFEPNLDEINIIKQNYSNDENLIINNIALGEKKEILEFNISHTPAHSSFNEFNKNTSWFKSRLVKNNLDDKKYIKKKINIQTITLDDYVDKNQISNIDVLKIDTQGFEDKVLLGAQKCLKENKIKLIQLELIFSEVYNKSLQIYDVEKILIPNKYRLFGISHNGSLMSTKSYQSDFLYISDDTYKNLKLKSEHFTHY